MGATASLLCTCISARSAHALARTPRCPEMSANVRFHRKPRPVVPLPSRGPAGTSFDPKRTWFGRGFLLTCCAVIATTPAPTTASAKPRPARKNIFLPLRRTQHPAHDFSETNPTAPSSGLPSVPSVPLWFQPSVPNCQTNPPPARRSPLPHGSCLHVSRLPPFPIPLTPHSKVSLRLSHVSHARRKDERP